MSSDKRNIEPDKDSSGFTGDLAGEMSRQERMQAVSEGRFFNISELYVSKSGPMRLLKADRYGRRCVLKCLREEFRYNPTYRQALKKEFEIGMQMDHPNISRTLWFEDLPQYGPTVVIEFIDGVTLEELRWHRAITVEMARDIARQIGSALDYIHSKQIVHRDIKPANIMIAHNGRTAKLIDFSLSDGDSYTILKTPAGTRRYMAPEQLEAGAQADARADVYSYGVVIGQLAEATGDQQLLDATEACRSADPEARPTTLSHLPIPRGGSLSPFYSWKFTAMLVIVNICLAAMLIFLIAG